jgi:hypothetical protein
MWVSIDDWHENPDIIHTKFTWLTYRTWQIRGLLFGLHDTQQPKHTFFRANQRISFVSMTGHYIMYCNHSQRAWQHFQRLDLASSTSMYKCNYVRLVDEVVKRGKRNSSWTSGIKEVSWEWIHNAKSISRQVARWRRRSIKVFSQMFMMAVRS